MSLALSPSRHWQSLLVVLLAHLALLAALARLPAPVQGQASVLSVEVLAPVGSGVPVAPPRAAPASAAPAAPASRAPLPLRAAAPVPPAPPAVRPPVPAPLATADAATLPAASAVAAPVLSAPAEAGAAVPAGATGAIGGVGMPGPASSALAGTAASAGAQQPPRLRPGARRPAYPEGSRWDREAGTVTLRLRVRPDGTVAEASVLRSSGFPRLDRAARDAALRWRLEPALRGGEAVEGTLDAPLEFRLED